MEGTRHRNGFEELLGRKLDVRKVVMTQHHPDHMGGWRASMDEEEIIAHKFFPWLWKERNILAIFLTNAPTDARCQRHRNPALAAVLRKSPN